ncbi:calcium:proton antiporter [Polycladidibacter stylochi]|uniref:calcium:proton antiporter n=1 Tax=Polycladidibacter stylochi TaxID=1807766 RepID=UPI0009E77AA3|nr:calcium:proton antiporter [Pseudovibrio stylochi]
MAAFILGQSKRFGLILVYGLLALIMLFGIPGAHSHSVSFQQLLFFVLVFGVMLWCAFGVVRQADKLAVLLGEPYGTLILTLSVIGIEVSLIVSIMLTGDSNAAVARDTMTAVLNIVLNGMVGLSLLMGGLRHGEQPFNSQGARSFLSVLIPLAVFSLILPRYTLSTGDPTLSQQQQVAFAIIIMALYAVFLAVQTIKHRSFFTQPQHYSGIAASFERKQSNTEQMPQSINETTAHAQNPQTKKLRKVSMHSLILIVCMVPIVLLSKNLAVLVDLGLTQWSLPPALGGVVVALLVLSPEGLSSFRAALDNRLQRSVNICLGSALATIGLTVPAVLLCAWAYDMRIVLGVDANDMVLLLLTLAISTITFSSSRTNMLNGAVHLVLFAVYFVLIFMP